MDSSPINRSLNLPLAPALVANANAVEEAQERTLEATKVTAPPSAHDSAPQGGTSGQPGLGEWVDIYDTKSAQLTAEKNAQATVQDHHKDDLEKAEAAAKAIPDIQFPFLSPLGEKESKGDKLSAQGPKPPGQSFDAMA